MSTTEDETRSVLMCRSRTLYLGSRSDRACFDTHFGGSTQRTRPRGHGGPAPGPRQAEARRRLLPRLDDSDSAARIKSRVVTRVVSARRIARSALAGSCSCSAPDRATDPAACGPCRFVVPRDGMCPMVSAGNTAHAPSSPRHTGRRRAGVTTRTHPCITHAGHSSDGRKHP